MKRENQEFYGTLKDRELYLIEDALILLRGDFYWKGSKSTANQNKIDKLIQKLYSEFAELPR